MSELKVNKISPRSGTAITLGDSGDTFTIPSGATLAIAGSVTGFTSAGIDDNATSVAITIDSSERVGIGSTAPGTDAGANADSLVIKKASGNVGMSIITDGSSNANIFLGDTSDNLNALVQFNDSANELRVGTSNGGGDLVLKSGAGVEALRIDDTGRVGIGTSSPGTKLEVVGTGVNGIELGEQSDGNDSSRLFFTNSTNVCVIRSSGGSLKFSTGATIGSSSGDDRVTITSAGKVGIGTSSPQEFLDISDNGPRLRFSDTSITNLRHLIGSEANDLEISCDVGNVDSNSHIRFKVDGSEKMRITSDGDVGIGLTDPAHRLSVFDGSTGIVARFATTGNRSLDISSADNGVYAGAHWNRDVNSAGGIQSFSIEGNEKMRINSSGLVLAGTTSAVNNGHTFKAISDSTAYFALSAEDATTSDNAIRGILSMASGNNGSGGTGYLFVGRTSDGDKFFVRSDGDVQNTNNSYGAISDRQLKENEVDASSQWNDIKSIQVKNYNLKSLPNKTHLGVIAQDLEASGMNGLVKTDEDGTKSVKYSILYMKSVKALQEAMERIETLEAEVTALKNQP